MHCNGANSYLFVNGTEIYKFKLNAYFYDFSVDYDAIAWHKSLNGDEPDYFLLVLKQVSKCGSSCNNINNP